MTFLIKSFLRSFVVLLGLTALLLADDAGQETPFSLGSGARSLGMGSAFSSLSRDATSIYYNPAGMAYLNYQEVAFMHSVLFEGTRYNSGAWVYPISLRTGIGVGYMRIGTGDIIRRENFINKGLFHVFKLLYVVNLSFYPLVNRYLFIFNIATFRLCQYAHFSSPPFFSLI